MRLNQKDLEIHEMNGYLLMGGYLQTRHPASTYSYLIYAVKLSGVFPLNTYL